jgi:hypothetical protein
MSNSPNVTKHHRAKSSSPIKSRLNVIKVTTTEDKCPVSDPSIGIISENDHRVGLCLCRFCECGHHTCPNPLTKDYYLSSTYTSKYKTDFKKTEFDVLLKPERTIFRPNPFKMDLKTTHKQDFLPFSVSPKKQKKYYVPNTVKMNSPVRSAYSNDFLDWGPSSVSIEKRFHPPVRSQEIPFVGQSSYKNAYMNINPHQIEFYKTDIASLNATNSTFELGVKDTRIFNTTYGEKMKDFSRNELNRIIKVSPERQDLVQNIPQHFQTTSKTFYQNHLPDSKDPRKVRLALSKKV